MKHVFAEQMAYICFKYKFPSYVDFVLFQRRFSVMRTESDILNQIAVLCSAGKGKFKMLDHNTPFKSENNSFKLEEY